MRKANTLVGSSGEEKTIEKVSESHGPMSHLETALTDVDSCKSHKGEKLECRKKHRKFPLSVSRKHIKTTDEEDLQCNACGKVCKKLFTLNLHKKTHKKHYACDSCNLVFDDLQSCKKHRKIHSNKHFSCGICSKSFTTKYSLTEHSYIHSGVRPFQCETCGNAFTQRWKLNIHRRIHDPKYDRLERRYQCHECGVSYGIGQRAAFDSHVAKHKETKQTCQVCGKSISDRENFKSHIRTHFGERPFTCQICSKSFSAKKYLISHKRTHSGEKPYKCDICGKTFTQKGTLNTHRKGHVHNC